MKKPIAVAAVGLIALAGLTVLIALSRPVPYTPAGEGIALGPAEKHAHSSTDFAVRLLTGGLDAAAGAADGGGLYRQAGPPTPEEQALFDLTNADRLAAGLPPLSFDQNTLWVARARAAAQGGDSPLSHYDSFGSLAFIGLLQDAGVPYTLAGENLARAGGGNSSVVERMNRALMTSPTHKANILEPTFDLVAIGAASIGPNTMAFAQIFRADSNDQVVAAVGARVVTLGQGKAESTRNAH